MDYLSLVNDEKFVFLKRVSSLKKVANDYREKEEAAGVSIQRNIRGYFARKKLDILRERSIAIQKLFRGFHDRCYKLPRLRQKLQEQAHQQMLNYFASQLQRLFRGHYSRKHKHDFRERKKYILSTLQKGYELRERLNDYNNQCLEAISQEQELKRQQKSMEAALQMHHLVGTQQQPGVFKTATAAQSTSITVPFDSHQQPPEEFLRNVVKDLLRTKRSKKNKSTNGMETMASTMTTPTSLITDLHGGHKNLAWKLKQSRISVQASSSYEAVELENKKQQSITRIIMKPKGSYLAGRDATALLRNTLTPLSTNDPYCDGYNNPALIRGVPVSQQQLNQSLHDRKAYFLKEQYQQRRRDGQDETGMEEMSASKRKKNPFILQGKGNKSSVLPNDLFDVIAEAEEYGGTAQRYLGMTNPQIAITCTNPTTPTTTMAMGTTTATTATTRFGLPSTVDNRCSSEFIGLQDTHFYGDKKIQSRFPDLAHYTVRPSVVTKQLPFPKKKTHHTILPLKPTETIAMVNTNDDGSEY